MSDNQPEATIHNFPYWCNSCESDVEAVGSVILRGESSFTHHIGIACECFKIDIRELESPDQLPHWWDQDMDADKGVFTE